MPSRPVTPQIRVDEGLLRYLMAVGVYDTHLLPACLQTPLYLSLKVTQPSLQPTKPAAAEATLTAAPHVGQPLFPAQALE